MKNVLAGVVDLLVDFSSSEPRSDTRPSAPNRVAHYYFLNGVNNPSNINTDMPKKIFGIVLLLSTLALTIRVSDPLIGRDRTLRTHDNIHDHIDYDAQLNNGPDLLMRSYLVG